MTFHNDRPQVETAARQASVSTPGAGGQPATGETATVRQIQGREIALFSMDLQWDFLRPEGRLPIADGQMASVVAAMNEALKCAARQQLDVVYITNGFTPFDPFNLFRHLAAIENSTGAMLDAWILKVTPSAHFTKRRRDAFSNERLNVHLTNCGVKEILIGGVHADACVTATTRTALRRGFDVTVLTDAVGATTEHARERACTGLARLGAKLATVEGALI